MLLKGHLSRYEYCRRSKSVLGGEGGSFKTMVEISLSQLKVIVVVELCLNQLAFPTSWCG
jgi:hypothetical protein